MKTITIEIDESDAADIRTARDVQVTLEDAGGLLLEGKDDRRLGEKIFDLAGPLGRVAEAIRKALR